MTDLEYISRVLSLTNYHEDIETIKKFGFLILDEMKNRIDNEILGNYVNVIRNLTMIDVYDLELMDNLLSPKYLRCVYKKSKQIDLKMYEIDGYCRINLKDTYNGNHLPDVYMRKLCFLITWVPDRVNRYKKFDRFSYDIEDVVNKLFVHSQYAHAIPYRKYADLFVCMDKITLKTIDISKRFPPLYEGHFIEARSLTKDDPNLIIFAFVTGRTKNIVNDDRNNCENIPNGFMSQKIEQLKMLGFHPITVPARLLKEIDQQKAIETFIVDEANKVFQSIGENGTITRDANSRSNLKPDLCVV
ncbi:uncharacterized protein LOC116350445 [Contarinia nasturtii]|uniref:uncharacterized protein LOC116350445 n=1 Tax=Contarinia nasturtii TaxID=265458 RepID=UPI0012D4BEE5|nr:uncharacterized protein LOC116350445 [Contarinia nasturtii]